MIILFVNIVIIIKKNKKNIGIVKKNKIDDKKYIFFGSLVIFCLENEIKKENYRKIKQEKYSKKNKSKGVEHIRKNRIE